MKNESKFNFKKHFKIGATRALGYGVVLVGGYLLAALIALIVTTIFGGDFSYNIKI